MSLTATVRAGPNNVRVLATQHGDDCLKAVLPSRPAHPRALHTLLDGLAMWHGTRVRAALVAGDPWAPSLVEDLFDGRLWPHELASVHFDIVQPRTHRRIRGPGDFRSLYLVHGRPS